MRIYNYLFYKTYLLAQRSKNFDDVPVLGGLVFVVLCLILNIFTVIGLLEGMNIDTHFEFKKEYKYIFSLSIIVFLLLYYLHKGRYKRIIQCFEQKEGGINLHPLIVIIIYYGISVFLMFLAATYKNQDWIFAQ
jgi:hypothetical protein